MIALFLAALSITTLPPKPEASIALGTRAGIAVFAANGPLSNPPTNLIWMRYARLAFYRAEPSPIALTPRETNVEVIRKDPAMDTIVGHNPKLFTLAEGFDFTA